MIKSYIYKFFLCGLTILLIHIHVNAQFNSEPIFVKERLFGYKYIYMEKQIKFNDLWNINKGSRPYMNELKAAKTRRSVARGLRYGGAGIIALDVIQMSLNSDADFKIGYLGLAALAASIGLQASYHNRTLAAIEIANKRFAPKASLKKVELKWGLTENGVGLQLQF